jgi:DNA-binding MarR family transcriptional regulator
VIEIRRRAAAGEMQRDLAAHYGVSQSTVSRIIARGIWIHV